MGLVAHQDQNAGVKHLKTFLIAVFKPTTAPSPSPQTRHREVAQYNSTRYPLGPVANCFLSAFESGEHSGEASTRSARTPFCFEGSEQNDGTRKRLLTEKAVSKPTRRAACSGQVSFEKKCSKEHKEGEK